MLYCCVIGQTDSREAVAVKVVSKKSLNKSSMANLLTEIEILKTVRHPHIVQLKDFQVQDPPPPSMHCHTAGEEPCFKPCGVIHTHWTLY